MKYVYATRAGSTEALVNKLELDALQIVDGSEIVDGDFILFTYTDGYGEVPSEVEEFLEKNNTYLKGVVATGNKDRHEDTFCFAADVISDEYKVPTIAKVHEDGQESDVELIKSELAKF